MKLALLPAPAFTFRLPSFSAFRARVSLAARRARVAKDTYRDLSRLSDRELEDIGISRGAITDVAREAGFTVS